MLQTDVLLCIHLDLKVVQEKRRNDNAQGNARKISEIIYICVYALRNVDLYNDTAASVYQEVIVNWRVISVIRY